MPQLRSRRDLRRDRNTAKHPAGRARALKGNATMNMHSKAGVGSKTALAEMLTNGGLLNSLPIGVYCCEPDGTICNFNLRAAALWGRMPRIGDTDERFCGAHKLFLPDGRPLP